MFILGVTGPSGAGKGTACEILKSMGFFHIDTDRLVPDLYPEALPKLIQSFGPKVAQNGTVDKKRLAAVAFASEEGTNALNSILHPLVMKEVSQRIEQAKNEGFSRVTVDGAALLEAHGEQVCNKILCILAPKEVRKERIANRDHIPEEAIQRRFNAQKTDDFYISGSDGVIINHTPEQLKEELLKILKEWDYE